MPCVLGVQHQRLPVALPTRPAIAARWPCVLGCSARGRASARVFLWWRQSGEKRQGVRAVAASHAVGGDWAFGTLELMECVSCWRSLRTSLRSCSSTVNSSSSAPSSVLCGGTMSSCEATGTENHATTNPEHHLASCTRAVSPHQQSQHARRKQVSRCAPASGDGARRAGARIVSSARHTCQPLAPTT